MGHSGSIASYLRDFQVIRSALTKKDLVKRHRFGSASSRQYTTFIAHDWKHGIVRECSCDLKQLGNYFVKSDLPFEISPGFFRPEVLLKYKADQEQHSGFGEGPREVGMADLRPRGPVALVGGFLGTLDHAAVGDKLLHTWEPPHVMDLIELHEAEDLADSGYGPEQIQGIRMVLLGSSDEM